MAYQRARGTRDEFPDDLILIDRLERVARDLFRRYGAREIRTPFFEETRLFVRGLGEGSDVVSKEMFTVEREESSYTFRPEGTAGVVRAYVEKALHKTRPLQKLYYIGPMFRYEKPQGGRQRQFTQIGLEVLGSLDPLLDAEAIHLAASFFDEIGLSGVEARVNSMGDREDLEAFRGMLRAWAQPQLSARCEDCRMRFEKNVLRMLDCKVEQCRVLNASAPDILDALTPASRAHLDTVVSALRAVGRPVRVDPGIVRGFDYYTRTVFELHHPDLGARSAVCGGGRYDHLISELGGSDLGAVGFAIGLVPTIVALEKLGKAQIEIPRELDAFVCVLEGVPRQHGFVIVDALRNAGLAADLDHPEGAEGNARSLKAQMKSADRARARWAVMLGPDEQAASVVSVRNLESRTEAKVPQQPLATLHERIRGVGAA
ncbi:MAG: histidine--tRNA ligase [Planctomycetes bacterium]|nr:histidine--tRNA ligase [Planctomycetota bacterium]